MPEGRRFEGVYVGPRPGRAPNSLSRVISRPPAWPPVPSCPPNGVGGTRRPPCAGSGPAAFMEEWRFSPDSGCVPQQQRASWRQHWRAARSRTPTASWTRPSTAARRASARTRRGSPGRRRAFASRRSCRPTGASSSRASAPEPRRSRASTPTGRSTPSYGTGGFVTARFAGTPTSQPGASAATALALDPSGDVLATGFGASQSMFVARFSPTGAMTASVVCFAPHLIDYTAYAIAERADGSVVIAGQARDRWHGTPYKFYGARAVVQVTGGSARANGCGTWSASATTGKPLGSSGVVDRRPRARRHVAGRQPRRPHLPRRGRARRRLLRHRGRQRHDLELHRRRRRRHRLRQRRHDDDPDLRAARRARVRRRQRPRGRRGHAARAARGGCSSPSSDRAGAPSAGFGTAGVVRLLAGTGNNQGQALALQSDGRILIAGGAVTSGNVSSFAVARLTAAGAPDTTWSPSGVVTTPLGATRLRHGDRPVGERVRRLRAARRQRARQRLSRCRRRALRRRAVTRSVLAHGSPRGSSRDRHRRRGRPRPRDRAGARRRGLRHRNRRARRARRASGRPRRCARSGCRRAATRST